MDIRRGPKLIAVLLFTGILITGMTSLIVNKERNRYRSSLKDEENSTSVSSPEKTENADKFNEDYSVGNSTDVRFGTYDDFLKKFRDVDAAIEGMKEDSKKNPSDTAQKTLASAELKYWETQLSSLYNTILSKLSSEDAAALAKDELDWKKRKDTDSAAAASKSAKTADESLAYTEKESSLTRERAYELLEKYKSGL